MAYDVGLEERIRQLTEQWEEPLEEKKMFGGIGYLIYGNMCFGIYKDGLIIRAKDKQSNELLLKKGISIFDISGRPMKNWLIAADDAIAEDVDLADLLVVGRDFALSLPPK